MVVFKQTNWLKLKGFLMNLEMISKVKAQRKHNITLPLLDTMNKRN